jgi:hypothetical protein
MGWAPLPGLQLEHLPTSILVHQSAYVDEILEKFNMSKDYLSKTPMIVRVIEKETDPFWSRQEGEEVLGPEYPYLSDIRAVMYLLNNTRRDVDFAVNLLEIFSVVPTWDIVIELRMSYGFSKVHQIWVFSIWKLMIWASLAMLMLDI